MHDQPPVITINTEIQGWVSYFLNIKDTTPINIISHEVISLYISLIELSMSSFIQFHIEKSSGKKFLKFYMK